MVIQGYTKAAAITPHDTTVQPPMSAVYVGVAGDIVAKLGSDTTAVTFKAVPVGIFYIRPRVLLNTGTTATNLAALSNV